MLRPNLEAAFYKSRIFLSTILLLVIFYFVAFTWLTLPPLTLSIGWHPDTKLTVMQVVEEEYSQYLQTGDVVLAVDGRLVRRGDLIFTPPVKPAYELTLQRGEQVFTQRIDIITGWLFDMWVLSQGVLALAIWFVGLLTVQFARPGQLAALYTGLSFQLIAAGIVSPGPAQLGAPGAWIVGHVLIFYFPLIMLHLGLVPLAKPLASSTRKLLRGSFYFLTILALVAAAEVVFLFPEQSVKDILGIRTLTILTGLAGISVVTTVSLLVVRLLRAPKRSYERQQLSILLVCLVLSLAPLFFFVILPLYRLIFIPFPFIYSLFLLVPAGYFFVLHRQGHLALDAFFGRVVTIVVLVLAVGMAYGTGMYLLETVFVVSLNGAGSGAFVLALLGIAITGQKPVQSYVDLLLYGRDLLGYESVQEVKAKLSANPEPATVVDVVAHVASCLNVKQAAVLVKEGGQYELLAGNVPSFTLPACLLHRNMRLRTRDPDPLTDLPVWVDLSLPITARGEMVGLFLLSRPENGYFNARQVETLKDIADILAFGLMVIGLVETMQALSRQALREKELQRRQIATEIHNEPLHTLTTLMMQLQARTSDETVQNAAQTIRRVTRDLRRIISDLRPPVLKESVEWITRQTVREFAETHDTLSVELDADIQSDRQASEQTKSAFYYILTEALNNISKHAQATNVTVTLRYAENAENALMMEVRDNGVGTNVAHHSLTELLRQHHIGLADMHRWASIGGGTLEIGANTPSGTVVKLMLPLE